MSATLEETRQSTVLAIYPDRERAEKRLSVDLAEVTEVVNETPIS